MINQLLLQSGADIPFVEATLTIHQPTLYEISLIGGEDVLFTGCELLKFSKDNLLDKDKTRLSNYTDFHILMSIINDKSDSMQYRISCARQVLDLLFPWYDYEFTAYEMIFRDKETMRLCGRINDSNFGAFKQILLPMFCLEKTVSEQYNTQGSLAKEIAEKLKKRKQQLATLKSDSEASSIFSRYISILTVGEHKDMNSFMKYTVYQLFDEFQRFELKMRYDVFLKARLAGAKDLKEPEDWMKNLYSKQG